MASGEHIVKLLLEGNSWVCINNGDRWLLCEFNPATEGEGISYHVYERKPYAKKTTILIETDDEAEACRILKGE